MQTENSNMEDIHTMMLEIGTCVFRIPMTNVLVQRAPSLKCAMSLQVGAL